MPRKVYDAGAQAQAWARAEAKLADTGGRRINLRLQKPGNKALARFMKKRKIDRINDALNQIVEECSP